MLQTKIEENINFRVDSEKLEWQFRSSIDEFAQKFYKINRKYKLQQLAIWTVCLSLLSLFIVCCVFLSSPLFTAISLSSFLFSLIGLYLFHRYRNLHKPDEYANLTRQFSKNCCAHIHFRHGIADHHSTLALAFTLFAEHLKEKEYSQFHYHWLPNRIAASTEILSCLIYSHDFFLFREMLLQCSIKEYINLVRSDPINLTFHSQLANAYVLLSKLYDFHEEQQDERRWKPAVNERKKQQYKVALASAIEEFRIISDYAPDDPWVHAQLAFSYKDLGLVNEEIKVLENLLKLCPSDKDALYRLGILYFGQGSNAKGLETYSNLSHIDYALANSLISHYGKLNLSIL